MDRTVRTGSRGFTLIELMVVIAIIGILMGLVGAAAYSAHQRAYAAQASAETQQIAAAFKSYYLAYGDWPGDWSGGTVDPNGEGGDADDGKTGYVALTRGNLDPLLGGGPDGIVFLDVPDSVFEGEEDSSGGNSKKEFLDPWGNPYLVRTRGIAKPQVSDTFEGAVSFPNALRHYYEDGVYTTNSSSWAWDDYPSL
jgi:prepilin-type N-terminal cleavage/methylation domain-containing protein